MNGPVVRHRTSGFGGTEAMSKSETAEQEDTDQKPTIGDQFTLDQQEITCQNGQIGCDGPDSETLPCFACFDPDRDYDTGVGR